MVPLSEISITMEYYFQSQKSNINNLHPAYFECYTLYWGKPAAFIRSLKKMNCPGLSAELIGIYQYQTCYISYCIAKKMANSVLIPDICNTGPKLLNGNGKLLAAKTKALF